MRKALKLDKYLAKIVSYLTFDGHLYKDGNRKRKRDGKISRDIRFRILTEDNHKFINKIGWIK